MQEIQEYKPAESSSIGIIMGVDAQQATKEIAAINQFQTLVNSQLKKDQDYGVIPGTQKPTLLKPGAEKILMLMGLKSEYAVVDKVEDFDKGFFAYTVQASLFHGTDLITQGLGAANTEETRYRQNTYDKATHRKSEWDGISYQDPYTLQNTVLKMAKKRAQVDATLTVGSLSNVFTQDVEDIKDFTDRAEVENMNSTDASGVTITFGKHRGKTLEQIVKEDRGYVEWLSKNAKEDSMRKAAGMLLNGPAETPQEPQQTQQYDVGQHPSEQPQQVAPPQEQTQQPASHFNNQAPAEPYQPPMPSDADMPDLPF